MLNFKRAILSVILILATGAGMALYLIDAGFFLVAIIEAVLIGFCTWFLARLGLAAMTGDFLGNIDLSLVCMDWVQIPNRAGGILHGLIYRDKRDADRPKPFIIITHGAGGQARDLEWLTVPLALNGFHVLAFNQSGHGDRGHRSSGNGHSYPEVMVNIHDVVDFIWHQPDLVPGRIGFIGHSTGGVMAHTQAYLNENIKVTIALSGIHDFMALVHKKFPRFSSHWWFKIALKLVGMNLEYNDDENRIISPRYCIKEQDPNNEDRMFLVQAVDDVLPVDEARANQAQAGISDANCLYLGKGGHNFRCQETLVVAQVLAWFTRYL